MVALAWMAGSPAWWSVQEVRNTPPASPDHIFEGTAGDGAIRQDVLLLLGTFRPAHVLQVSHWEKKPNVPAAWDGAGT